eukprot:6622906-Alexandrium_andersonii.AAC.1
MRMSRTKALMVGAMAGERAEGGKPLGVRLSGGVLRTLPESGRQLGYRGEGHGRLTGATGAQHLAHGRCNEGSADNVAGHRVRKLVPRVACVPFNVGKTDGPPTTVHLYQRCRPGRKVHMDSGGKLPLGRADGPLGIAHDLKLCT